MSPQRLSRFSQLMASITLWFLVVTILFNSACWLLPKVLLGESERGEGLMFLLSAHLMNNLVSIDVGLIPWWQLAGAMILSTIPLLALAYGLYHLRMLFQTYGRQKEYFSIEASRHMGKIGQAIIMWTVLNLVCEPLLSIWITMREPVGHRLVAVSFNMQDIVAIFLAACIIVIAHIMKKASELHAENQQFV